MTHAVVVDTPSLTALLPLFHSQGAVLLGQNGESEPVNIRIRVNILIRALLELRST
jgi:hypothetical protein